MSKKPQKKSPKSAGGRGRYTPEFRQEALLLAVRVGVADAAEQLGVAPGLLYTWQAKAKRKFKATTNSNHQLPVAPNLLNRNFTASALNQKWVGDITYLATPEGWLYLAVFIDLYARKVVGWSMGERMTANLVCDALKMAWFRCKRPSGVIVHTDRGSQYCSNDFQSLLKQYGMRSSMSRKGDCWDNAVAESFFHSFKVEGVQGEEFGSRVAMRETVFEYIELYYNRHRLHSSLGYMSPEQFEARKVA